MSGIFRMVLSLSLSGSLLILALLLLENLAGRRLSRRWRYYIWLLAIARLLLPLTPPVSLMGALFPPAASPAVLETDAGAGGASLSDGMLTETVLPDHSAAAPEPAAPDAGAALEYLRQRLWLIWLTGALFLLARRMTEYQSFVRFLRAGGRPVDDPALLDRLACLGAAVGVRRPVELYESAAVSTPLLIGLCRPCIVLPDLSLSEEDFRYTVCHELIHCRRRDLAYKRLAQLTLCVHWFNPLVWRMVWEIERACELSCDEAVIAPLSDAERRAYGDTLLRSAGRGGCAASLTLSESGKLLKERLHAIMNDRKTTKMSGMMSLLLALVLAAGAAASGASAGAPAPRQPVNVPGTPVQGADSGAASLPKGDVPAAVKGDSAAAYRYTQEVYGQSPYFFELGWNVSEAAGDYYPSLSLPLPSGGSIQVYYDEICRSVMEKPEAMDVLAALLDQLREEHKDTEYPLKRALVVSVRSTGGSSVYADTAEQAYGEGSLAAFTAAFGLLSEDEQRTLLSRSYADNRVAFFNGALFRLSQGSSLIEEFARRSYADGRISFFSVLAQYMDRESLQAYLTRAQQDGRTNYCSVLYKALDMDDALAEMEEALDRQLEAEYRAHGITTAGKNYFYQGQLVNIFLDMQPNKSFYRLDMNPLGTVNIKILRGEDGEIQGVGYMSEAEREELFGGDEEKVIPVAVSAVESGQIIWLGTYDLKAGDSICYDISAETGSCLQVGFAVPGDTSLNSVYYAVKNTRQQGEPLECTAAFTVGSPAGLGTYQLFLRAPADALENVFGHISITSAES